MCLTKYSSNRKPNDKIIINKKMNFYVLSRNIDRSPDGTQVQILETNQGFNGICGKLKTNKSTYIVRSELGFIIGSSYNKDDLILLIAEHNWHIENTEIANIVNDIKK